ncbi:MAG TPA: hypothetical protein PL157_19545, partial [Acidobacteriota bacterium]|nr:hypothetical protein [Acidobacteriota bacterium]
HIESGVTAHGNDFDLIRLIIIGFFSQESDELTLFERFMLLCCHNIKGSIFLPKRKLGLTRNPGIVE